MRNGLPLSPIRYDGPPSCDENGKYYYIGKEGCLGCLIYPLGFMVLMLVVWYVLI